MAQLRMIFNRAETPMPEVETAQGYNVHPLDSADVEKYYVLRESIQWGRWNEEQFAGYLKKLVSNGLFVAEDIKTGVFAASAAAEKTDFPEYPQLGVLGWVLTHPEHTGHHLGRIVSVTAMHTLANAGYQQFSLLTDDFRIPALHTYLTLGWQPWLYLPEMEARWRAIAEKLNLTFESLKCIDNI